MDVNLAFNILVFLLLSCAGDYDIPSVPSPAPGSPPCDEDEYDSGYDTCLKKQSVINTNKCPMSTDNPPPGGIAQCVGGPGEWNYIHIGGKTQNSSKTFHYICKSLH